jgi:hypothetical protein
VRLDLRALLISSRIREKEKEMTEKGIAMEGIGECPFLSFPLSFLRAEMRA